MHMKILLSLCVCVCWCVGVLKLRLKDLEAVPQDAKSYKGQQPPVRACPCWVRAADKCGRTRLDKPRLTCRLQPLTRHHIDVDSATHDYIATRLRASTGNPYPTTPAVVVGPGRVARAPYGRSVPQRALVRYLRMRSKPSRPGP
jgi:hypothetical protein